MSGPIPFARQLLEFRLARLEQQIPYLEELIKEGQKIQDDRRLQLESLRREKHELTEALEVGAVKL